jgi:CRISPR-associated protein Cmr2
MGEKLQELGWKQYATEEYVGLEERYQTPEGEWLFLYEHPITNQLSGVPLATLDTLRQDFAFWLRDQVFDVLQGPASRWEKLEKVAQLLYSILRQSPPSHPWLSLPADSRPQRNRSTVAYHSLLVSAFACAMARAWVQQGQAIEGLLRFQPPTGQEEIPVELPELMNFMRVACLCHDFGKHPPQRHNERGKEQVRALFFGLLEDIVIFDLSEVAHRHHTARSYRERGESPIGILEELIAHADTLASATDRPILSQDPDPVRSVTAFFRNHLGDEQALSLISADTDRVKSYVFESARLPEVRGASALLTQLNEERMAVLLQEQFQLPRECLLYAAGGSALIVAPTALAEDISNAIQRLYLEETDTATISVVYRPTLPREWVKGIEASAGYFGNLVKWLGYDLRRAKESRVFYLVFEALPYAKRCDSCEVRPAEERGTDPSGREVFSCGVCKNKRDFGRDQKSAYLSRFEDEFLRKSEGAETPYGRQFAKLSQLEKVSYAQDLHEVGGGAEGKARGYVGVIYTDGNDIGSRIERSQTPAEFRTLSEKLWNTTKLVTFKALAQHPLLKKVKCSDGRERVIHPFEIVAIGGDDVFLIVPGDVALDIASTLCEEFASQFDGKLTMSAGVLIMREHFPIYYARNIVESLLKNAKKAGRKVRQAEEPSPSFIDFQVITGDSSLSDDLEGYREQFYAAARPLNQVQRLIKRPYSLSELRQVLGAVRWAKEKKFPASQLYQLRQAVVEHVILWSQNWYRYQLARDERKEENGWRQFHQQLFGTEPLADTQAPWRFENEQGATPIVDLVEVFDYVRKTEGAGTDEAGD